MAGEHEFCWEEAVRRLGAEEKIPETLADKDLYTLSKAYVHALKKSSERKKYLVLSESLFLRLKEKGESRYIISVWLIFIAKRGMTERPSVNMTEMTWLVWLRSIMNDCAIFKPMNMNCMNMPGLYIGVHHFIFMMAALPIDIH